MAKTDDASSGGTFVLGFFGWLGGAVWVANQPGYGFWDGMVWLFYVGRYVAAHFAMLTPLS